MKISLNWLKSYIDLPVNTLELATLLTQRGLEVTQIHPTIKGGLEGLIIGQVISCTPHPNADRLQKTLVDVGSAKPLSIICGAPNIQVGLKVIVAPVGTIIYNYIAQIPFQIKKVKIRGELSEGMICSEKEIGLGPADEGILALATTLPAGTAAKVYFKDVLDEILDIDITPNRADACSHLGVARDLKAILHLPITLPTVDAFSTVPCSLPLKISSVDSILCPRYCGLLLKNVTVQPSPTWLCTRLASIGVKAINNVVDVTNFILYALGQPLHAFDYDTLLGKEIMVKQWSPGERFMGLDGVERTLTGDELMICDVAGPIAIAGVLGGIRTSITHTTQNIFIESAYFNPTAIGTTARQHNLSTAAAFRFERGTDPNMVLYALKRAAVWLQQLMPAAEISEVIDLYPTKLAHFTIPITYAKITRCLGTVMSPTLIKQITTDLEIDIEDETHEGFRAKVPPYRVDVTREIDFIEEIARIYGYDALSITGNLTTAYLAPKNKIDQAYKIEQEISKMLAANSYYEIWTNSLSKTYDVAMWGQEKEISILNPLSTSTNVLRHTLLFSGLEVIAYNFARRQCDLKFFEFGKVYSQVDSEYKEEKRLAIWLTGQIEEPNWVQQLGPVTLQQLRMTIEQLTQKLGIIDLSYGEITHPYYKQAAQVTHQGVEVMTLGQVKPSILNYFSIAQPVFFADIQWNKILEINRLHRLYLPISKFPAVKRDLALVVNKTVLFENIKDLVLKKGHKNIQAVKLFDVYEGIHLPADKKSYAIRFTLQDKEKTLDDTRIDQIMHQLMQTFERDLNAIIRR
ncbi:phenylalanine--tRNA ligase subunit beta [Candidatus Cardinium hertigii]|uniref:Phenylalanine--tRNA ligase beta subunit n=1 Tax=Candidatus Cardinium hertigii TaxID=247481 RepID=A0A3N2QBY9_9BACT|nr:phenylalanine--tRNA ligase subunit beta [Candidatus Cardinium hertigii]ROT47092.1 phenylalanine--tRNA ligase subunit beta [Candidatus Cardinium hertigii]